MKVLVLWYNADPPSTSVVEKKDIKYSGNSVKARWERKWFDAKIIAENGKSNNDTRKSNSIKLCYIIKCVTF